MNAVTPIRALPRNGSTRNRFPTVPLYAAIAMIGFAATATVFGTITDIGTVRNGFGEPAAIRDIVISGSIDDRIEVIDARSNSVIASYAQGEGGFVRGSMRALSRIRFATDVNGTEPYRLIRWRNGALTLSDTVSGERIFLDAFGPDNAAVFAKLIEEEGRQNP